MAFKQRNQVRGRLYEHDPCGFKGLLGPGISRLLRIYWLVHLKLMPLFVAGLTPKIFLKDNSRNIRFCPLSRADKRLELGCAECCEWSKHGGLLIASQEINGSRDSEPHLCLTARSCQPNKALPLPRRLLSACRN